MRDQNIARLQIAVYHQVAVRVSDGLQKAEEQAATGFDIKRMLVAKDIGGLPFHQFHHEERTPVGGGASVQESGDAGMIQVRQDLPLVAEPRQHFRGVHAPLNYLDGDLFAVLVVVPNGQVHCAHAAATNLPYHTIGPQPLALESSRLEQQRCLVFQNDGNGVGAEMVRAEQRFYFGTQLGIARASRFKELVPLIGREVRCREKQLLHAVPGVEIHYAYRLSLRGPKVLGARLHHSGLRHLSSETRS